MGEWVMLSGGLYHALNRGNARATTFRKRADFEAFERILAEGLERYDVQLFAFQLMANHWHFVVRPNHDGEMSRFCSLSQFRRRACLSRPVQELPRSRGRTLHRLPLRGTECVTRGVGDSSGRLAVGIALAMVPEERAGTEIVDALADPLTAQLDRASEHASDGRGT